MKKSTFSHRLLLSKIHNPQSEVMCVVIINISNCKEHSKDFGQAENSQRSHYFLNNNLMSSTIHKTFPLGLGNSFTPEFHSFRKSSNNI